MLVFLPYKKQNTINDILENRFSCWTITWHSKRTRTTESRCLRKGQIYTHEIGWALFFEVSAGSSSVGVLCSFMTRRSRLTGVYSGQIVYVENASCRMMWMWARSGYLQAVGRAGFWRACR